MSNQTPSHINDALRGVAESQSLATVNKVSEVFQAQDRLVYVKNDTIVDPSAMLGQVFYESTRSGQKTLNKFLYAVDHKVDDKQRLASPETAGEFIVDNRVKGQISALGLISASLEANDLLEVRVINNAKARLVDDGPEFRNALRDWNAIDDVKKLKNDSSVGSIFMVAGVVQKYLTTKMFRKYEGNARGGAYGVNVEGSLYLSTTQFTLTVIYGLDLTTLALGVEPTSIQATPQIERGKLEATQIKAIQEMAKVQTKLF